MTDDGGIRASDADREHVVEILREAYSAGRLTLEEFDERTTLAFAAKTWGGLRELTRDLPQQARLEIPRPDPQVDPARDKPLPVSGPPPGRRLSPMLPILVIWLGHRAHRPGSVRVHPGAGHPVHAAPAGRPALPG